MDETTRREALHQAAALCLLGTLGTAAAFAAPDGEKPGAATAEKANVMAIGMTEAEADCWLATADAAGKFFALPQLHPMDKQEVATAIHVLQNKLLSRPTYRKYLETVKARGGK